MKTRIHDDAGVVATYWAVYPDGRRCEVTLADAKAFGDEWGKQNIQVKTVVRVALIECVGIVECDDGSPYVTRVEFLEALRLAADDTAMNFGYVAGGLNALARRLRK